MKELDRDKRRALFLVPLLILLLIAGVVFLTINQKTAPAAEEIQPVPTPALEETSNGNTGPAGEGTKPNALEETSFGNTELNPTFNANSNTIELNLEERTSNNNHGSGDGTLPNNGPCPPVPEPHSVVMIGIGLVALSGLSRLKRH